MVNILLTVWSAGRIIDATDRCDMTAFQKLLLEALTITTSAELERWRRKMRLMKENANAR